MNKLINRLITERNNKIKNGFYHHVQIDFAYNTNHIEGSTLTKDDTRTIFERNTILTTSDRVINVKDITETQNHFICFDYLLDTLNEQLSEKLIKKFHHILKSNTPDSKLDWFKVGDYKKYANEVGDSKTALPEDVPNLMKSLINDYLKKDSHDFNDIVAFHVEFEKIHPFQDGNGRVGRLIMFRECLKNNIVPFIVLDKYKEFYYRGLKEYKREKGYLNDTLLSMQDQFKEDMKYFGVDSVL